MGLIWRQQNSQAWLPRLRRVQVRVAIGTDEADDGLSNDAAAHRAQRVAARLHFGFLKDVVPQWRLLEEEEVLALKEVVGPNG